MNLTRLYEHYQRVLRDDMLTIFSRVAHLSSVEVSMVLDTAGTLVSSPSDTKYKAACVLELLTHSRPVVSPCNIKLEGLDKIFQKSPNSNPMGFQRGRSIGSRIAMSSDEYRKVATTNSGLKLSCTLKGTSMYIFLEKLREFYLPDLMLMENQSGIENHLSMKNSLDLIDQNTSLLDKSIREKRKHLTSYFQLWNKTKQSSLYPSRVSLSIQDNPWQAVATYFIKSSEILKFPDIEDNFEPISSILNDSPSFYIYIRPTVEVSKMVVSKDFSLPEIKEDDKIDRLKIMNYLLANIFNPYMRRLSFKLKSLKPPQPLEHICYVENPNTLSQ